MMTKDSISLIAKLAGKDLPDQAVFYDHCGADALFFDGSRDDGKTDISTIRNICAQVDIPLYVSGNVNRFEDIKKMIYAGARGILIGEEDMEHAEAVREASDRFGSNRLFILMKPDNPQDSLKRAEKALKEEGVGGVVLEGDLSSAVNARTADYLKVHLDCPVWGLAAIKDPGDPGPLVLAARMAMPDVMILDLPTGTDIMSIKQELKKQQLPVNLFESEIPFEDFKLNADGMIPCITQDYKTGEVLMMAYMTEESYRKTLETGKMTYFSRSRGQLWTKGETSGHYQYVKSLRLDCDKDTILAEVAQIGAACHTGSRTCFFTDLVRKEADSRNPLKILEDVFGTILERKEHPKEGSYTNYLFDQGIDKILKKVGEEAAEIVIAAKNPDAEELKYEICDFLYHMMVLMADQELTWKEITDELARRH